MSRTTAAVCVWPATIRPEALGDDRGSMGQMVGRREDIWDMADQVAAAGHVVGLALVAPAAPADRAVCLEGLQAQVLAGRAGAAVTQVAQHRLRVLQPLQPSRWEAMQTIDARRVPPPTRLQLREPPPAPPLPSTSVPPVWLKICGVGMRLSS